MLYLLLFGTESLLLIRMYVFLFYPKFSWPLKLRFSHPSIDLAFSDAEGQVEDNNSFPLMLLCRKKLGCWECGTIGTNIWSMTTVAQGRSTNLCALHGFYVCGVSEVSFR